KTHDIVVMQDSYFGTRDGATSGCAEICQQILLNSSYAVAVADREAKDWRVYREAHGQDIGMDVARRGSYFRLLAAGVPDTCIVMTRQAPGADALIVDEDLSHDSPVWPKMPKRFNGAAYEYYERDNGVDKLLGRAITGNVQPVFLSGDDV